MRRKIIYFSLISLLVVILLPLVIDWLIIGNEFPSNIENSDWVGFLGGYVGSILGCIISLVGIAWTIDFTNKQNREDRELENKPVLDLLFREGDDDDEDVGQLGYVIDIQSEEKNKELIKIGTGTLIVKNVGNGPATNIFINDLVCSNTETHKLLYVNSRKTVNTKTLRPDEQAKITFENLSYASAVSERELRDYEISGYFELGDDYELPFPFSISATLTYCDLLNNQFSQTLKFEGTYVLNEKYRIRGRLPCVLHLSGYTNPEKIRR